MKEATAKKLLQHVQESYNLIADEFSDSRYKSWEEFKYFKPYLKPQAEIVDLGCGNGRLLDFLNQEYLAHGPKSFHYIGIDNSNNLLKNAKKKHPEAIFLNGDQLTIPISENQADCILNIAAFHHIPSYSLRFQALLEMNRVLKTDGYLIITVWNLWQKKYFKALLKSIWKFFISFGDYSPNDLFISWKGSQEKVGKVERYYHAFLPSELIRLVKKANFEIIETFAVKKGQKVPFLKSFNFCIVAKKLK